MYKQLFTKSKLTNKEINQRLGIVNIQRERFYFNFNTWEKKYTTAELLEIYKRSY